MSSDRGKLGNFLREVIDWQWDEFCEAEKDPKYSGLESSVFALVRACSDGKLAAIKLAIDRVDGKVETPIKIEYPRVYVLYPYAETLSLPPSSDAAPLSLPDPDPLPETEKEEPPLATITLRETLEKMADASRQIPLLIHDQKMKAEKGLLDKGETIPLVKSVIAANLLILANEKHSFEAITEIFDRIDGKLVETIRLLGSDIYLTNYGLEAPFNAVRNKDGVYQVESPIVADQWGEKLGGKAVPR